MSLAFSWNCLDQQFFEFNLVGVMVFSFLPKNVHFITKNAISCLFLKNVSPSKKGVICFILNNLQPEENVQVD